MTTRTRMLRENLLETTPSICTERARLITESYKETEAEPISIRRAKALEKILSRMSIYILPGELIVGNLACRQRAAPIFPEFDIRYIEKELDEFDKRPGDVYLISDEAKQELRELFKYWRGKTLAEKALAWLPEETKKTGCCGVGVNDWEWWLENGDGHFSAGYPRLLERGVNGVIKEAEEQLESLDLADPESLRKKHFLESVIIANKAVIAFAKRYAELARGLAGQETDQRRKAELKKIAEICEHVPANPARTFHEAIQSVWFAQLVIQIDNNGLSVSMGRFDQYMYPFYKRDIEDEIITRDEALELVECLWIKINSILTLRSWAQTKYFAGYIVAQNLTIGGQTPEGEDATNELSYICLGAQANVGLWQPQLTARYHDGCPEEFLRKCCEVIRLGSGMPALFNDEVIIPNLLSLGVKTEHAFDYCLVGCVQPSVQGIFGGRHSGDMFNLPKCLELALYNGLDPRTGYQLYPGNGDLTTFITFDEVMEAYRRQVEYYVKHTVIEINIADLLYEEYVPTPFPTSLFDDCIKRGKELKQGGAVYDCSAISMSGLATVANSLAAIKKLVFEDKAITSPQLMHALKTNFMDSSTDPTGEEIRQMLIHRAPKYGNDNDYVDHIAREAYNIWMKAVSKHKTTRFGRGPIYCRFSPDDGSVSGNVPFGMLVGATPDGRKAGEPVSDTTSASQGTDVSGPTALVKSVAKLNHFLETDGQIFNIKFHPAALKDEAGLRNLMALIKTYFDLKGQEIQVNVVSAETLRDAQKHPEKYRGLIVRVAGYSAHFTMLDKAVQDDIIARTEQYFA